MERWEQNPFTETETNFDFQPFQEEYPKTDRSSFQDFHLHGPANVTEMWEIIEGQK